MYWDIVQANLVGIFIVFARVIGIFSFNPLLSRRNVPVTIKVGLSIALSIIISSSLGFPTLEFVGTIDFIFAVLREFFVGFTAGFVMQMFLSTILMGGELMDMQAGLSMAKVYDPSLNIQMPVTGSILNLLFVLYFFAVNGHLSYIYIFSLSYDIIPIGAAGLSPAIGQYIFTFFSQVLILAIKMSLPIIAAEFLAEFSVGILMKAVPQIQVIVVNIQLKLFIALILLVIMIRPMANFLDRYMEIMFENIYQSFTLLVG